MSWPSAVAYRTGAEPTTRVWRRPPQLDADLKAVRRALARRNPLPEAALTRLRAAFHADPSLHAVFGSYDDRPAGRSVVSSVRNLLHQWEKYGFCHLPICMAKTQYSFTTDPTVLGAPSHHTVPVREVRLAAGAGFIVAICGDIMTMPGLPKVPSAENIRLVDGQIEGLF